MHTFIRAIEKIVIKEVVEWADKKIQATKRIINRAYVTKLTGYMVGGCSPFGTKQALPVYVEKSILALPEIYINGGKRGFLVKINPQDLQVLKPIAVEVAVK